MQYFQNVTEEAYEIICVKYQCVAFNINQCQILHIKDYEMCSVKIKSIHLVKDLGTLVMSSLKFSHQSNEPVKKGNRMRGLIKKNF